MVSVYHYESFRSILLNELDYRCQRNSRYSMRAFARDLKVPPHRMSEILNGKVGISRQMAERLAQSLKFSEDETSFFCDLVDSVHCRSQKGRARARDRLKKTRYHHMHNQVPVDTFEPISDWYHYAILELISLSNFNESPQWIAKTLNIKVIEVQSALRKLFHMGFIIEKDGKIELVKNRNSTPGHPTSQAVRKFQGQILKKSMEAMNEQQKEQSEFNSTILAIDKDQISEAKTLIRDFWRNFSRIMAKSPNKESVYCLSMQFFELTKEF